MSDLDVFFEQAMRDQIALFNETTVVLGKNGEAVTIALWPSETRVKMLEVVSKYLAAKPDSGDVGGKLGRA